MDRKESNRVQKLRCMAARRGISWKVEMVNGQKTYRLRTHVFTDLDRVERFLEEQPTLGKL